MSGLFESLTSASNALNAHRLGLDVTGQNMANINTVGYSRRVLQLAEQPPADLLSAGRGVEVLGVRALRDEFLNARLRGEQGSGAFNDAVVESLATIEASVGPAGAALDQRMTEFFDAFAALADDVTSLPARDGVVEQGRLLSQAFGDLSARLALTRRDANLSIRGAVDEINRLSQEVAALNQQIMANGPEAEALRDQRGVALARLSELAGATVMQRPDGAVDVTIGQGRALVVATNAYAIDAQPTGPSGDLVLTLGGITITSEMASGRIGGLVHGRDVVVPAHQGRLDQLAFDIATQVNAVHTAGFDLNGAAGVNFFAVPGSVAGAAGTMAMNAAVAADSRLVAGSATGAIGDNGNARNLAVLREAGVMTGGATAAEAWAEFVYHVGSDVAGARSASTSHTQIINQLLHLRDQASGVSLDEEAAHLMRYQRAYEASARYFTSIVETIDTVLEMVR